jgi:hypothetical protein
MNKSSSGEVCTEREIQQDVEILRFMPGGRMFFAPVLSTGSKKKAQSL